MFKRTLVAAALLTVGFNASAALTYTTGASQVVGVEGTVENSAVALAAITVASPAGSAGIYASFNGLTINLSGATFNPATSIGLVIVAADDFDNNGSAVTTTLAGGDFNVTFSSTSTAKIVLTTSGLEKFDATTEGDLEAGINTFAISGININSSAIANKAEVTATVSTDSNIPNTPLESGSSVVAVGATQFKATTIAAERFSKEIDVASERKEWSTAVTTTDSVTISLASADVALNRADASAKKATVTLKGDFSWLDGDSDGKLDTGNSIKVGATDATLATDLQSASFTTANLAAFTGTGTAGDVDVKFDVVTNGDNIIPVIGYSADVSFDYVVGAFTQTFAATGVNAGAWKLNGDGAFISFLPFGAAFSQSVTITNTGSVVGDISVDWYVDGTVVPTTLTTKAGAKAVTDISSELRDIAAANGVTGNVALNIVVNSPSDQIRVDALYYSKADQDRAVMATDK